MRNIVKDFAEEMEWLKAAKQKMAARLPEVKRQVTVHETKVTKTNNPERHLIGVMAGL